MAQPQPNYQRLAEAFTTASEECSRLVNIPAVTASQTLVDLIGQLRDEMRQSATRTTERLDSLQTEMTTLRAAVSTVQADVTIMRADISAIHTRLDVR